MAKIQDAMMFSLRDASPNDIVYTQPEKFWILPYVVLVLREKSLSLMFGPTMRHLSHYFKIDNVCKSRKVSVRDCQKLLTWEGLMDKVTF